MREWPKREYRRLEFRDHELQRDPLSTARLLGFAAGCLILGLLGLLTYALGWW